MRPTAHMREQSGPAAALDGLWADLVPTLAALDRLAAEPELLAASELAPLQYRLHRAAELADGLTPFPVEADASEDLAAALAAARDATAYVGEVLESDGLAGAEPLVWEWRGALFAVRLAHSRLRGAPRGQIHAAGHEDSFRRPLRLTTVVLLVAALALVLLVLSSLPFTQ